MSITTTTTINVDPSQYYFGQEPIVYVEVTSNSGTEPPVGKVEIYSDTYGGQLLTTIYYFSSSSGLVSYGSDILTYEYIFPIDSPHTIYAIFVPENGTLFESSTSDNFTLYINEAKYNTNITSSHPDYASSNDTITLTVSIVNKYNPSLYADSIQINYGTETQYQNTDYGVATFTITNLMETTTINILYDTVNIQYVQNIRNLINTSTSVSLSFNAINFGEDVVATIQVTAESGFESPYGTVEIYSNGNLIGSIVVYNNYGTLTSSSDITINTSTLNMSPGQYTISAKFILNTYYQQSESTDNPILTVTSSNSSPIDISLSSTTIAENNSVNDVIGTLSTTDPDGADTFSYSLVNGTGDTDNDSFNISGSQLRAGIVFDFETKSTYSIRIRSTDLGGLYYEKQFTITIINIDDIDNNQIAGKILSILKIDNFIIDTDKNGIIADPEITLFNGKFIKFNKQYQNTSYIGLIRDIHRNEIKKIN